MFLTIIILGSAVPLIIYYFKLRAIQSRLEKSNNIRACWTYLAAEDLIKESFKDDPEAMSVLIFKEDVEELLDKTKRVKFQLYASGVFYLAVSISAIVLGK